MGDLLIMLTPGPKKELPPHEEDIDCECDACNVGVEDYPANEGGMGFTW